MELIGAGRGRGGEEALPFLPLFFHSYRIPPLFFSRHPLFMYLSPPAFTSILPPSEHPSTSPSTPRSVLPRSALCAALTRPIFAPPPLFFPPFFLHWKMRNIQNESCIQQGKQNTRLHYRGECIENSKCQK